MTTSKASLSIAFGFLLLLFMVGCSSHSTNPTVPAPAPEKDPVPAVEINPTELGHELLGAWNMTFDPEKMTATVEPNREMLVHWNVKSMIPTPGIKLNSFDPVTWTVDVDVTLQNPYPITGYDVRLIIYKTYAGHFLLNADNWTSLFDIPGGNTINPFKAYAKEQPLRVFAGPVSYTENLVIHLGGNFIVPFAVDASYPSNCEEPYQIGDLIQDEPLYDRLNDTAPVALYAYRWNTQKSMTVIIDCPEVLYEPLELDTPDYEYYHGTVVNFHDAPAGEYQVIITAHTDNPVPLYSIDTVYVTEKPIYGWVIGFPDEDKSTGVEIDEFGNSYFALNPSDHVVSYNRYGMERWDKDLNNLGPFSVLNDISYHPDFDYIYCTGDYTFCGSYNDSGLSVAKCGKSSGAPTHNYQCFSVPGFTPAVSSDEITSDSAGNAYIVGRFEYDGTRIMWKVDSMLNHQWNQTFNNSDGGLSFYDLEISSNDKVLGTGKFWGEIVDLDPTSGIHSYEPLGAEDAFFAEYDSSGNWVSSKRWGGYNDEEAQVYGWTMGFDDDGNIFIGGGFEGTVDFNPSSFGYDIKTSAPDSMSDVYISKFNSSKTFQKNIQISTTPVDSVYLRGLAFDMYDNVYVCGLFEGTCDFDPGTGTVERTSIGDWGYDMFLAKYTSDLEYVWVQTWGTTGFYDTLQGVAYDRTYDYLYVVGTYSATMDFDPGDESVYEMTPKDDQEPFLMRLLPNGMWEY